MHEGTVRRLANLRGVLRQVGDAYQQARFADDGDLWNPEQIRATPQNLARRIGRAARRLRRCESAPAGAGAQS